MVGGVSFGESGFESGFLGEVECGKSPCAQASCIAHCAAHEIAVLIDAVGEEAERSLGRAAFFHYAESRAGADIDGCEAGFGCAGAKVASGAVSDAGEPWDVGKFGEHFCEGAFDGCGEIVDGGQRDGVEVAGFEKGGFPAERGRVEDACAGGHADGAGGALGEFGLEPFCGGEPERDGFENCGLGSF